MRFKIDWASLLVGSKCTVFALFYFVFEGNFTGTSPGGRGGLIFGGAYFLNFRVSHHSTHGYLVSFRPFGFEYFSGYYTAVCGKTVSHQLNLM